MLQALGSESRPAAAGRRVAARVALGRTLLGEGEILRFVVRGASMWPVLRRGDVVQVEGISIGTAAVGDIVLCRQGAVLLAHRVVEVLTSPPGAPALRCRGDTRLIADPSVGAGDLLGRIRCCERGGARLQLDRGLCRWWGRAMLHAGWSWALAFSLYRGAVRLGRASRAPARATARRSCDRAGSRDGA